MILDIPALVFEGEAVTLCCSTKTSSTNLAVFYKDDTPMHISPMEKFKVNNVSKFDEGFYSCHISDGRTSPGSWLFVRGEW